MLKVDDKAYTSYFFLKCSFPPSSYVCCIPGIKRDLCTCLFFIHSGPVACCYGGVKEVLIVVAPWEPMEDVTDS